MAAVVRRAPKAKNVGKKALTLQKQIQVLLDTTDDADDEGSTTPKKSVVVVQEEEDVNNFINNNNNRRRQDRRRRNKIYTNINKKKKIKYQTSQQHYEQQEITKDDIQSITIETPTNVTIQLVNGTTLYNINPQELHQRQHLDIWLSLRQMLDVTASEFSAILDQSFFTTRNELLTRKVTTTKTLQQQQQQIQQSSSLMNSNLTTTTTTAATTTFVGSKNTEACKWGLAMEPIAFQQYIDATNNVVQETGLHIKSIDMDVGKTILLGASPDGLVIEKKNKKSNNKPQQQQKKKQKSKRSIGTTTQDDDDKDIVTNDSDKDESNDDDDDDEYEYGLLEIKCLYGQRTKKKLKQYEYCPKRFYDQIQGQLAICDDVSWCDLIVWIPRNGNSKNNNDNYSIVRVHRNETYWNTKLLPEIQTFVKEVRTRTKRTNVV